MTDLRDRTDDADSGEILPWDTVELPAQPTRSLKHLRTLPPTRALRLADAGTGSANDTCELPLMPTGAELAVRGLPTAPIQGVRPDDYRPRHRRPAPVWALLVTGAALGYLALVTVGAALAVIR